MAIIESITRMGATFVAILHTRAELMAIEVEEEAVRYFTYLLMALAAMFCTVIAVLLVILLIVAVYWDTHRIGVLLTLIGLFVLAAIILGLRIRASYRHKPRLLAHSLNELSKDISALKVSP
jgi:uncharacterized membrane protein YqjE